MRFGQGVMLGAATILCGMLAVAASAQEYRPTFRPDRMKGPPAGPPNQVLVLGGPHLSAYKTLRRDALAPLLDRLAAWKPEAIATENLSGLLCDTMRRFPVRYSQSVAIYCPDPSAAGKALNLDVPAANAEAQRLLAAWPASPGAAQRRRLAAVFLAAGEPGSAMVQWLRLPSAERRVSDGLDVAMVAELERRWARPGETEWVGAALAARVGLERLYSVDDHSADSPTPPEQEAASDAAISHAWDNPAARERQAIARQLDADIGASGGVLALYRGANTARAQALAFQGDFGATLVEPSPQRFGRQYVGYWETRNLRMVANIRDVLGLHPGTRLLAIVGASHKGYYEAYLNQMHDVQLIDAEKILR
ncbi:DUF5694 domain-containing protein [Sphingomonas sp. BE138]|uniref:DUF5694 domain-containing protein n=1 Tax=Sphingomonas sp. BE138 TaxID=2817845 RepID=UPI00286D4407|nr:DUF5694 domain-containing protein [Sphingomonas sp. BE138]